MIQINIHVIRMYTCIYMCGGYQSHKQSLRKKNNHSNQREKTISVQPTDPGTELGICPVAAIGGTNASTVPLKHTQTMHCFLFYHFFCGREIRKKNKTSKKFGRRFLTTHFLVE